MKKRWVVIIYLFLSSHLFAQDIILQGRFWVALDPISPYGLERPYPDEEKIKLLWEQARTVFSGMIYGWKFTYEPGDLRRSVEDKIVTVPVAQIKWGERDLEVTDQEMDEKNGRFWLTFRYIPKEYELKRLSNWKTATQSNGAGQGGLDLLRPGDGSFTSVLDQSLKTAVRFYMQQRTYDKPRKIQGEGALKDVPMFGIQAGRLTCQSNFLFKITAVETYKYY